MAAPTLPGSKVCAKCLAEKPLECFAVKSDAPDGLRRSCRSCLSIDGKAHYAKNREKVAARSVVYRAANKEVIAARNAKWQAENPEKVAAKGARYRQRHPEELAARRELHKERDSARATAWHKAYPEKSRAAVARWAAKNREKAQAYRAANKDRIKAQVTVWRAENPEAVALTNHRNRAKRRAAEGSHSRKELRALLIAQGNVCANPYCRCDLTNVRAVDHIVALAVGGTNWIDNIQYLCQPCNSRKHTHSQAEFLRREALRTSRPTP